MAFNINKVYCRWSNIFRVYIVDVNIKIKVLCRIGSQRNIHLLINIQF